MQKTKIRGLLNAILAILCALAVAAGVSLLLPKNQKTASAATDLYNNGKLSVDALDTLSKSISGKSYKGFEDLLDDLKGGATLKVANFGNKTVTYGGKDWFPVYASGSTLTLWLSSSIGSYSWSDGTYTDIETTPATNDYLTSWIHAAINAGKTTSGTYYGGFNTGNPVLYQNNQQSSTAFCAPTDFTALKEFAKGGKYSEFIGGGIGGDNLWLPSADDAKVGGTWGCTVSPHFSGSTNFWTSSKNENGPTHVQYLFPASQPAQYAGKPSSYYASSQYAVRPAINLDLSSAKRTADAPKDVEVTYNGNLRFITDAEAKADWFNSDLMDVTYQSDSDTDMINAGTYTVKVELTNSYYKFGGEADPSKGNGDESDTIRYFNFTINKATPTLTLSVNAAGKELFTTNKLSDVTIELDSEADNPKGAIAWTYPNTTLKAGTEEYEYTFTSQDDNYKNTTGKVSLTVGAIEFKGITAEYTQGNNKIFTSAQLNGKTANNLPGTLLIKKVNNDGSSAGSVASNNCTLVVSGTLTAGDKTITVRYTEDGKNYNATITITVSAPELTSISAVLKEGKVVYDSTSMVQLAQMLEVTAEYADDTSKVLDFSLYTVTGTLVKATNSTVTVTVNNAEDWAEEDSGICQITVPVEAAKVTSIKATFEPIDEHGAAVTIYDRTANSELTQYITVVATYDDGSTKTLTAQEYALTGSLLNNSNGTARLTVEYGGQKDYINVTDIVKAELVSVEIEGYYQGGNIIYDTDSLDKVKEYLTVKAVYSHKDEAYDVTDECRLEGTLVASDTEKSVIKVYFTDSGEEQLLGEIEVTVSAGDATLLDKPTLRNASFVFSGEEIEIALVGFESDTMRISGTTYATDAGTYKVVISLKDNKAYRWADRSVDDLEIEWTITPLVLDPQVSEIAYTGEVINIKSALSLTDGQWQFITASGDVTGTDAGSYSVTLTIKSEYFGNVVWAEQKSATKKVVKALVDGEAASADRTVEWNIIPATVTASWDDSKEIPTLNLTSTGGAAVPAELVVYTFTDKETGKVVPADKLQRGRDYTVTASLNTEDARSANYAFTAPQPYELSLAAAPLTLFQKIANFMTSSQWGLPVWAWFAIGLAVLILLIIIIAVCAKRRKTKEQREEIKARKEEEKQRREDERRMQQERLQAERELAMAKQQAELEKIRAQSGMATMAMPAQQAMPAPVQQAPVQQPVSYAAPAADSSALAEIKAELAEIKARQNMMGGYAQPMQMPMPQYYQQPMQMPAQSGEATAVVLAKMEAEFAKMQLEFYKMQNGVPVNYNTPQVSAPAPAPVQALPQPAQEEIAQPVAQYPSDAVITTTTTVDTTKKSETPSLRRTERDSDSSFVDVDGFYDSID